MSALVLAGIIPAVTRAQQPVETAVVFDGATVVDVEQGKLVPSQRVVIVGNRIQAVGNASAVKIPKAAQVVDALGKYLIPGLWDMHTHSDRHTAITYPLFLAHGVTGIRDGGSDMTLDTLIQWRREILAGTRLGPPRQVFSGPHINFTECESRARQACLRSEAEVGPLVDSLKAAGADMLKMYHLKPDMYFFIAAKARKVGLPFGGHLYESTPMQASDSGAILLDHLRGGCPADTVEECKALAEQLKRNGTYYVPTLTGFSMNVFNLSFNRKKTPASTPIIDRLNAYVVKFWEGTAPSGNWLKGVLEVDLPESARAYRITEEAGLPIVAGTDVTGNNQRYEPAGISLQGELASYVSSGVSPLTALQSATLNPAKALRATDSLGTVAAGKLADVVLLDADPLADITNITTVHAVVANGRYFDRQALDKIVAEVRTMAKAGDVFADKGMSINP